MALSLTPPLFAILSRLIEEATGLHYGESDSEILADRLSIRATELGFDSLLDYYYFLRYDEGGARELVLLVDHLVVNETYFFREIDQLRALVDHLIPELLATRPALRIWCAACSTGEEPQTLAMLLEERGMLERIAIVATDISTRVLDKARAGVYRGRALRALEPGPRARHFIEAGEEAVRVREQLRAGIEWQRVNLFDFASVERLGRFDIVLCRNALIYFQDETVLRLVERFAQSLTPRGLLLVGASESLLRFGTAFDCEEHGGAFFYRRSGR